MRRANYLIHSSIGGNVDREKGLALTLLHQFVGAKRRIQQWNKAFENLIKRHLELCVDLKDHHQAKDGLYKYSNLCQNLDPGSLEVVILYLFEIAENKAKDARGQILTWKRVPGTDLGFGESLESVMLSSMSEESSKERTDEEIIVPWLNFLWEMYRAVLELLNKSPKFDKVYHKTCEKAFAFCKYYRRSAEFIKLCSTLRKHLSTPSRQNWDWTAETVDLHLETRFIQLEVATELEQWNEGFRTIEDIHAIMQIGGGKSRRAEQMAVYYEKLSRIFWVSKNHLFHAFTSFRFYCLTCERHERSITDFESKLKESKCGLRTKEKEDELEAKKTAWRGEKSLLASSVLLAVLSIPALNENRTIDLEEIATEKNQQMAVLLDLQSSPTRKALLSDIVKAGVLEEVIPELANIYNHMEIKFHPLSLVSCLTPTIAVIESHARLAMYAIPVQRVSVLRVVQQLSRVYSVMRLDALRHKLEGLKDVSFAAAEKIIVDAVARKQLKLRMDHSAGCVRFGVAAEKSLSDEHVAEVGASLNRTARRMQQFVGSKDLANEEALVRRDYIQKVVDSSHDEYLRTLERKDLIEQRKIGMENAKEEKEAEARIIQEQNDAAVKEREKLRLYVEIGFREKQAKDKEELVQRMQDIQKELGKYGINMELQALVGMETDLRGPRPIELLDKAKKDKLLFIKQEETKRLEQMKYLDYVTRAFRKEACSLITESSRAQMLKDDRKHQQIVDSRQMEHQENHQQMLLKKTALAHLQRHRTVFEVEYFAKDQRQVFDRAVAVELAIKREKIVARARQKRRDKLDEEDTLREEEKSLELEEAKRKAAQKLTAMKEADATQRLPSSNPGTAAVTPPAESWRPKPQIATVVGGGDVGEGNFWRRGANALNTSQPPSDSAASSSTLSPALNPALRSTYVPPSMRTLASPLGAATATTDGENWSRVGTGSGRHKEKKGGATDGAAGRANGARGWRK